MKWIKRAWQWLTGLPGHRAIKYDPDLNPYDVSTLVQDLNLREEAKRLGQAGLPAHDAVGPGGAEAVAIERVERVRQDYVNWAIFRLAALDQQLAQSNVTQLVNQARQAAEEFSRKASALIAEHHPILAATSNHARQVDAELKTFKAEHGLTRAATYPSGARAFLGYALLFLLIVVEGLLNATFFAQGLDTGLIGGAAYAMTLAALNVTVAYTLGRWPCRYINHRGFAQRAIGWAITIMAAGLTITIGLAIAHFRDALTSGSLQAPKDALQSLVSSPWQLQDLMSWGLFCISIAFAVAAFFDGFLSDDAYPRYGKITRRHAKALEAHEEEIESLRVTLNTLRDEELGALKITVDKAKAQAARCAAHIQSKHAVKLRLRQSLDLLESALVAVLGVFRQENELARRPMPRPPYFDRPPELSALNLPDFDTTADEMLLAQHQSLVAALLEEQQQIRANIQAAYIQRFDSLTSLPEHFPTTD